MLPTCVSFSNPLTLFSPKSQPTLHSTVRLQDGASVSGQPRGERVIRDRILLLPQPGFLLSTNIQRLFAATTPSDLPPDAQSEGDQARFLTALLAAATAGAGAGFTQDNIPLMGVETTKTPYADYIGFQDDIIDPLKPVTHGQFKFTRLDIIDEFGQAVSAIDPKRARPIRPLISTDTASSSNSRLGSTKGRGSTLASCIWTPIRPSAGDHARSGKILVKGFLVFNYAEYALKVFLPDGTFYREVRRAGPSGATETPS
ncbi:hypothetical protein F5B18DRAFT_651075 [Nemania serpens]|nr:hypothetical protein F5B18DRAFT_651075 [Nemania serpens]